MKSLQTVLLTGLLAVSLLGFARVHAFQTAVAARETPANTNQSEITLKTVGDKQIQVEVGGKPFTAFDYGTYAKPILYPIYGPGQIGMTRNWPMKDGVKGEAHDHPHHKSMWITTEISGVDFWGERGGSVKTVDVELGAEKMGEQNAFRATSLWQRKSDGKTLLSDQTTYRFGATPTSRWIDCTIEYRASHGDFQFDDTKEGLFAIRTHPDLRLTAKPKQGVKEVFGQAINSAGVTGKQVWGKPAKWLLYSGTIDGTPMSIAMYDHPSNLRHPTTWHARDYGLVTANPFGLHHFLGKPKGTGAYTVNNGETLKLRYRVEFIGGQSSAEDIEKRFKSFAKSSFDK